MKYVIVIGLLFTLIAGLDTDPCVKYNCVSKLTHPDACMKLNMNGMNNEVNLKPCDKEKLCDTSKITNGEYLCVANYTTPRLYPGEYCITNSSCLSQSCVDNVCRGRNESAECSQNFECNPGLRCLGGQCKNTSAEKKPCTTHEDCRVNLVCTHGYCRKIGSLQPSDKSTVPGACSTFYIEDEICEEAPKLAHENLTHCSYTNGHIESPVCGMANGNKKYCRYMPGDVKIKDVFVIVTYSILIMQVMKLL